jgi:hypothetical protein
VNGAVDFTADYGRVVFAVAVGALLAWDLSARVHDLRAGGKLREFTGTLSVYLREFLARPRIVGRRRQPTIDRRKDQSMFSRRLTRFIAIGTAAVAIAAGAYGIVSATATNGSGTATTAITPSGSSGLPGRGGSNARSGPAVGGAVGTVTSAPASAFTLLTSAGQKVTVNEVSSTRYRKGTSSISAGAVEKGESVLVLGTTNGTTITAGEIIVQPTGGTSTTSSAVVPFQRGARSASKQVGQIPASYSEGSGTIVSGRTAYKATEAALGAYPGGIVDRVVKLSNGEYEVHNIGVNWPHHIFVNQDFKVIGAD